MTEVETKFYDFRQNNSGGSFHIDKKAGISICVIVEAVDHNHANSRAEDIGLYWNGSYDGSDCPCCGDRWYEAYKDDGDPVPSEYGTPITEKTNPSWAKDWANGAPYYFVHYLDGRVEGYKFNGERVNE